jgi:hypothetical protein
VIDASSVNGALGNEYGGTLRLLDRDGCDVIAYDIEVFDIGG